MSVHATHNPRKRASATSSAGASSSKKPAQPRRDGAPAGSCTSCPTEMAYHKSRTGICLKSVANKDRALREAATAGMSASVCPPTWGDLMGSGVDSVPSSSSSVLLAPAPGSTPSSQALFSIPEIPSAPVQDDLDLSQLDPRLHPIASLPPRTPPSQPIVPAIPGLELYPHSLPTSPRSRSGSAAPDEVAHQAEDDMDGWDDDVDLGEGNREDPMAEDDNEDGEVQEQEAGVLDGNGGVIREVSAGAEGLPVEPPSLPLDKGKGKEKPKEAPPSLSHQQKLAKTSTGLTASARIKTFQDNARRLRNQIEIYSKRSGAHAFLYFSSKDMTKDEVVWFASECFLVTKHPNRPLETPTPHEATNSAYELLDRVAEIHRQDFNVSTIAQFRQNAKLAMKKQLQEVAAAKEREEKAEEQRERAEEERERAEEERARVQAAYDAQAIEFARFRAQFGGAV